MQSLDELGHALPCQWVGRPVEHASFDDFFVQLPDCCATQDAAVAWGDRLRRLVMRATGLRCSLGLARTKLLSVLATKRAKPNGMYATAPFLQFIIVTFKHVLLRRRSFRA